MSDPAGRLLLFGAVSLGAAWVISTALHENIEHFANLEEERKSKPLTEDEQLARDLIAMRERKVFDSIANSKEEV
jgi:hypothetical protein